MPSQSDRNVPDELATGALSKDDAESFLVQPPSADEAEEFSELIQALTRAFAPVDPAVKFADDLRVDLLGQPPGLLGRLRKMPARVHIAAALALIAGCLLFVVRRLFGSDVPQEIQEEAVATPL